jgi:CrcB protein
MIQLLIAVGGAIGAVARFEVGRVIQPAGAGAFPWATLVINVAGSLLLGFTYRYVDAMSEAAQLRAFIGVGFCGGFTTFSTFSYDAVRLLQDGQGARGATYIIASVAISILGTFTGIAIASALLRQ